ncbi:MAG: nuclear transport factor 2 family protein [Actinobacteria bacterium]|nr:nuclear transport factor 2 family protein [Actinomycetota bacterium]
MTDDELATLHRYLTAWGDGDVMTVLGSYHERLELRWPGTHRLSGTHAGRDAAVTALAALQAATGRVLAEVRSITPADGFADVELVERWTIDGSTVDLPRRLRFGVEDGLIAWCEVVELEPDLVDRVLG